MSKLAMTTRRAAALALGSALILALAPALAADAAQVGVQIDTEAGAIVLALDAAAAPLTVANFRAYVERGLFKGATFYRSVGPANDNNPATLSVIQGGLGDLPGALPPIAHETTARSGLRHGDGVISMARDAPGSASSEFFICLGDNPALDFGGRRNADGQGFAAFGRVVRGMDVVRKIHAMPALTRSDDPYLKGQMIAQPVRILGARRVDLAALVD